MLKKIFILLLAGITFNKTFAEEADWRIQPCIDINSRLEKLERLAPELRTELPKQQALLERVGELMDNLDKYIASSEFVNLPHTAKQIIKSSQEISFQAVRTFRNQVKEINIRLKEVGEEIFLLRDIKDSLGCTSKIENPEDLGTWRVCESYGKEICGTWSWDLGTRTFKARFDNGAMATMNVLQFDAHTIIVQRVDNNGATPGLTAIYQGTRNGDHIVGTVVWHWNWEEKGWTTRSGTWKADKQMTQVSERNR